MRVLYANLKLTCILIDGVSFELGPRAFAETVINNFCRLQRNGADARLSVCHCRGSGLADSSV